MSDKIPTKDISGVYCPLPFNHMNLHPNGNVGLCCVSEMFPPNDGFYRDRNPPRDMMNLSRNNVSEMWLDSSVVDARNEKLQGINPTAYHNRSMIEESGRKYRKKEEIERKNRQKHEAELRALRIAERKKKEQERFNAMSSIRKQEYLELQKQRELERKKRVVERERCFHLYTFPNLFGRVK